MINNRKTHQQAPPTFKVAKQILSNVLCSTAALMLVGWPLAYPVQCLAEEDATILKPDVPKLDLAPSQPVPKGTVLKGNVAHHAKVAPPPTSKPKRLNSRIVRPDIGPLNGLLKGTSDKDKGVNLGAELQQPYTIDRTIGIIGIKFLKVGERPPLVNRVFPGTPAYKNGLSVDDIIVAVDGVPTSGLTKDECYDLIVGTPNTPITVTLMHHGSFEVKNMVRMDFNEIPDPMVRRDYLHSL
jgi:hypothetical protein